MKNNKNSKKSASLTLRIFCILFLFFAVKTKDFLIFFHYTGKKTVEAKDIFTAFMA
jgi:hypothetical protein